MTAVIVREWLLSIRIVVVDVAQMVVYGNAAAAVTVAAYKSWIHQIRKARRTLSNSRRSNIQRSLSELLLLRLWLRGRLLIKDISQVSDTTVERVIPYWG